MFYFLPHLFFKRGYTVHWITVHCLTFGSWRGWLTVALCQLKQLKAVIRERSQSLCWKQVAKSAALASWQAVWKGTYCTVTLVCIFRCFTKIILPANTPVRNVVYVQNKYCICWCNSQLWSPSPAGSRYRNMCHLCRDRTPPAPHSAWWLNVSTLWAGVHTNMQILTGLNLEKHPGYFNHLFLNCRSCEPLSELHIRFFPKTFSLFFIFYLLWSIFSLLFIFNHLLDLTCRSSGDTPSAGPPLQVAGPHSRSYSPQVLG